MTWKCTVYMGSASGSHPKYVATADALGKALAASNAELVYGGGRRGLMGTVADAMLACGAKAYGVMTTQLVDAELSHEGLTTLDVVGTMQERRLKMLQLGDAFIALPGGIGTLEELIEVLAWCCQGWHQKPLGLLNIDHMYTPFVEMVQSAVKQGLMDESVLGWLVVAESPSQLVSDIQQRVHGLARWRSVDSARCIGEGILGKVSGLATDGNHVTHSRQLRAAGSTTCAVFVDDAATASPAQIESVVAFAQLLAREGVDILYRGSRNGLAGILADAALNAGGRVVGVVQAGRRDGANVHPSLSELDLVEDSDSYAVYHRMFERASWFAAMPGGAVVWQDLFEVYSAAQLRKHLRPMAVLNVDGFYDPLFQAMSNCADGGFIQHGFLDYIVQGGSPAALLAELRGYKPTPVLKSVFKPEPHPAKL